MLPPLPKIVLEFLEDLSPDQERGFLELRREAFIARFGDLKTSRFNYDHVRRAQMDAVILVAHFARSGERYVYLRSSLRPPIALRPDRSGPLADAEATLWELPAGLIEADETSPQGILGCAARELEEELGFDVSPEAFRPLGPKVYPLPAMIGEFQYFLEVEVVPEERGVPSLDGSPLEQNGAVQALPLSQALRLCNEGRIPDGKTELGLRRLADRWPVRE